MYIYTHTSTTKCFINVKNIILFMGESEIKYCISEVLFRYVSEILCFHGKSVHGVKIEGFKIFYFCIPGLDSY